MVCRKNVTTWKSDGMELVDGFGIWRMLGIK